MFLGGAVLLGMLFVLRESRARQPLLLLRLFRSASLSAGTTLVILLMFGLFGAMFFMTFYLENVHGLDPVQVGVHLLPMTAMLIVGAPLSRGPSATRATAAMAPDSRSTASPPRAPWTRPSAAAAQSPPPSRRPPTAPVIGRLALLVIIKRLPSNCRYDVSALAEHGRLCTVVHNRVHRQHPLFGRVVSSACSRHRRRAAPGTAPGPDRMREIYARHAGRLRP